MLGGCEGGALAGEAGADYEYVVVRHGGESIQRRGEVGARNPSAEVGLGEPRGGQPISSESTACFASARPAPVCCLWSCTACIV